MKAHDTEEWQSLGCYRYLAKIFTNLKVLVSILLYSFTEECQCSSHNRYLLWLILN